MVPMSPPSAAAATTRPGGPGGGPPLPEMLSTLAEVEAELRRRGGSLPGVAIGPRREAPHETGGGEARGPAPHLFLHFGEIRRVFGHRSASGRHKPFSHLPQNPVKTSTRRSSSATRPGVTPSRTA